MCNWLGFEVIVCVWAAPDPPFRNIAQPVASLAVRLAVSRYIAYLTESIALGIIQSSRLLQANIGNDTGTSLPG